MAAVKRVNCVDEIFCNASAGDEASLVSMKEEWDVAFEAYWLGAW